MASDKTIDGGLRCVLGDAPEDTVEGLRGEVGLQALGERVELLRADIGELLLHLLPHHHRRRRRCLLLDAA